MDPWLWLGVFILLAYTVEVITGFGSIVIALSLGALLLPIAELLPVLVPLNILMTGWLSFRYRRYIHWPTLLRLILPLMVLGTVVGYLLRPFLGDSFLQLLFGLLIVWFSGRELWRISIGFQVQRHPGWLTSTLMAGAGITHGLFASGGPLLVYALAGTTLDKARFRATLISVWLVLNSFLTVMFLVDGSLLAALPRLVWYLPVLLLGVVAGERLHHRVDEQRFRKLVFLMLLITGALLLGRGVFLY